MPEGFQVSAATFGDTSL